MIRLSKSFLTFLAAGVFAVFLASLGTAYYHQTQEQDRAHQQLTIVQAALKMQSPPDLASQLRQLEGQAAQAESQVEAAKQVLSQPVDSIAITNTLFDMARRRGVEVVEIGSSGVTSTKLEGFEFDLLPLRIRVTGDVANLVNFILELGETFPTGELKSLEVTVPLQHDAESGAEGDEQEKPSAKLEVHIHQYKDAQTWSAK